METKKNGRETRQNVKASQKSSRKGGSQNVKRENGKDKSQKEDEDINTCNHVKKGVDRKCVKSAMNSDCNTCQDCKVKPQASGVEEGDEVATIWMCLQCGYRGCGRNSENQHAVKHFEKPRTALHCLVVSMDDWSVWCYECNQEVECNTNGHIGQLVTNIKNKLTSELENQSEAVSKKSHRTLPEPRNSTVKDKNKEENKGNLNTNGKKGAVCPQKHVTAKDGSVFSVKGLYNLGNTCFFNSVIQNLCQTWMLRQLLSKVMVEKINVNVTPGTSSGLEPIVVELDQPGSLTLSMCQLLGQIQRTKEGVVSPGGLFTQVCKKSARFKGFKQQDSQELLRYLLDGMRAEETKRLHAGISEALTKSGKMESVKEYEKSGSPRNFVDEVFGGEITSTVMCRECNTVSSVTETFLDLSLPVSDEANSPGNDYIPHPKKKHATKQKHLAETRKQTDAPHSKVREHTDNGTREETPVRQLAEMGVSQQDKDDRDTAQAKAQWIEEDSCVSSINCNRFTVSKDQTISQTDQEVMGEVADEMDKRSLDEAECPEVMDVDEERDFPAEPKEYTVVNQDAELAFHTLATRTTPEKGECSVQSCLFQFTKVENLTQANRLLCATCTARRRANDNNNVYTDAVKQMLISSPPPVLTLHLKRFQQIGHRLCKVNRHVQFPHKLDLAPFCAAQCKTVSDGERRVPYSLYGIVEHSGTMRSGHYTARVKAPSQRPTPSSNGASMQGDTAPPRESWFHVSDGSVQPMPESKVGGSQAYLLFYERIPQSNGPQDVSL